MKAIINLYTRFRCCT